MCGKCGGLGGRFFSKIFIVNYLLISMTAEKIMNVWAKISSVILLAFVFKDISKEVIRTSPNYVGLLAGFIPFIFIAYYGWNKKKDNKIIVGVSKFLTLIIPLLIVFFILDTK